MEGYLMRQPAPAVMVDHWYLLCYSLSLNNLSSTNQRAILTYTKGSVFSFLEFENQS